jgi:hypothetical protein
MALRTKTIEYAFLSNTSTVNSATKLTFSNQILYIPENSSRTFRSVILEIGFRSTNTTITNVSSPTLGVRLGVAAESTEVLPDPPLSSNAPASFLFQRNVTSYFNSNFGSGTLQECAVSLTLGGINSNNHTAKLYITYEYDDSAATTRVKTVRIPLQSLTGGLTTTNQNLTPSIPALNTFLPESGVVIRNIFFEFFFNESRVGGTTDPTFRFRLNLESLVTTGPYESAPTGSTSGKYIWNRLYYQYVSLVETQIGTYDSSISNTLSLSISDQSSYRFDHPAVIVNITYEYNHTNSTRIINSLCIPFTESGEIPAGTLFPNNAQSANIDLWIQEPGTITGLNSGFLFSYGNTSLDAINLGVNNATVVTSIGQLACSCITFISITNSIILQRGLNNISIEYGSQQEGALRANTFTPLLILNYTSDKHSEGDGAHNHTTIWSITQSSDSFTTASSNILNPVNIPESNYFLTCNPGIYSCSITRIDLSKGSNMHSASFEFLPGEGLGFGWGDFLTGSRNRINCTCWNTLWVASAIKLFNQYPNDPDDLMNIEYQRSFKSANSSISNHTYCMYVNYHSITYEISGVIGNGAAGGIEVRGYRADNGKLIDSTTSNLDGSYSMIWYDNTIDVFTECIFNENSLGRSNNGKAI